MEKSIDRMCEMRIIFYFLKSNHLSRSQIVLVETTLVLQRYYKTSALLSLWPASIMEGLQPNNTSQQLSSITSPWRLAILLLLCKQTLRLTSMSLCFYWAMAVLGSLNTVSLACRLPIWFGLMVGLVLSVWHRDPTEGTLHPSEDVISKKCSVHTPYLKSATLSKSLFWSYCVPLENE